MTHEEFMRLALEEASKCETDVPVGAVLVQDGKVIASSHNTRQDGGDPVGHAEINVLREAARGLGTRRLEDCTMYVTLEPCPMCAGAIALSGITRVVYGAKDPAYGCCGSVYRLTEDPAFPNFAKADGGCREGECAEILTKSLKQAREKADRESK